MKIKLVLAFFLSFSLNASSTHLCEKLASPRGVVITTVIYGASSAVSNFMWGFNWHAHTGISAELAAQLQEVGGISVAAENIILGVVIPLMVWGYVTKEQGNQQKPKQTFMQFIRGRDAKACPMAPAEP